MRYPASIKKGLVDVSIEQIIAWNPDVIWLPPYVNYTIESLLNDPAWSNIKAIKIKRYIYARPLILNLGSTDGGRGAWNMLGNS